MAIPRCEAGIGMNYERYLFEISVNTLLLSLITVSLTTLISSDCLCSEAKLAMLYIRPSNNDIIK